MIKYLVGSLGALALILTPIDESTLGENEDNFNDEEKLYDDNIDIKGNKDKDDDEIDEEVKKEKEKKKKKNSS
jgi:hypothetical protein